MSQNQKPAGHASKHVLFPRQNEVAVGYETVTDENLGPDEAVIEGLASVVSAGTELARLSGIEDGQAFPHRPGYGMVAKVLAKGRNVPEAVGDVVFCAGKHARFQRFTCNQNHQWERLFPVPAGMDPVEAAVGCMAQIAMTAPNLCAVNLNDTVAVFGLGMVGMLAALLFKLNGARVIGLDPAEKRCRLAEQMGLDAVLREPPSGQVAAVMALTGGGGARVAVDAVGHSAVLANAVACVAMFGDVLSLGSPRAPCQMNATEVFSQIHLKCCRLTGAHMWQMPVDRQRGVKRTVDWAFGVCFDLIRSKRLDVAPLISHVLAGSTLEDTAAETYAGLRDRPDEYTCAVIDWRK
ncbi:MAG: zinc-binding alcohol dehydrogenase [Kiritimatiellaeota bacterium]|nr:zinc-binding alcohol dehydrogenase [Kiritimatiellota bacterium]